MIQIRLLENKKAAAACECLGLPALGGYLVYEAMEDEIFDGFSAKAFYFIVADDDIMVGTIYYFHYGSNGLQLIGTMPY